MNYWHNVLTGVLILTSSLAQAQSFSPAATSDSQPALNFDNKQQAAASITQKNFDATSDLFEKNANNEETPASVQNIQDAFLTTKKSSVEKQSVDPFAIMSRTKSETISEKNQNETAAKTPKKKSEGLPAAEEDDDFFVPADQIDQRIHTPTVDGSERGGQAFVMIGPDGKMKKVTNIFLFYDDFKINSGMAGYTTCSVRFNIISNLDRKLSQFDVKLVWPKISTTLSFSDIPPNTQTYYNYTLLGEGCYTMDKAPNIVVNRCRAKGMTSAECAAKIKWVAK